jgi:hypothetical protein
LVVLVVVAVAAVGMAVFNSTKASRQQAATSSPSANNASQATGLKTYTNEALGLAFQYPKEYGDISLVKDDGSYGGHRFTGQFSGNTKLKFIIASVDYRDDGEDLLTTFRGHYEADGRTYYRWADPHNTSASAVQIGTPVKTLSVDGRKVFIVDDNSFVRQDGPAVGPGAGNVAGLANLRGAAYPGVVFITSMPANDLEPILSSLEL